MKRRRVIAILLAAACLATSAMPVAGRDRSSAAEIHIWQLATLAAISGDSYFSQLATLYADHH